MRASQRDLNRRKESLEEVESPDGYRRLIGVRAKMTMWRGVDNGATW